MPLGAATTGVTRRGKIKLDQREGKYADIVHLAMVTSSVMYALLIAII